MLSMSLCRAGGTARATTHIWQPPEELVIERVGGGRSTKRYCGC